MCRDVKVEIYFVVIREELIMIYDEFALPRFAARRVFRCIMFGFVVAKAIYYD